MYKILHLPTAKYCSWSYIDISLNHPDDSYTLHQYKMLQNGRYSSYREHYDWIEFYGLEYSNTTSINVKEFELIDIEE